MSAATLEGLAGNGSEFAPSGYEGYTEATAPCSLGFQVQPTNTELYYDINPSVQVAIKDCSGNVITTATNTVSISLASGSGIRGNLTAAAVKGIATFFPAFNVAGNDVLLASSTGLSPVTSSAFSISTAASTPCKLGFAVQPTNTQLYYDISPSVQVAVEDCSGDVITTATNTVTITLASGSGIRGNLTAAAVKGIATFFPAFNVLGNDVLLASAPGLTPATSNAFTIGSAATAPCKLVFQVQPTSAQTGYAMTPTVQVAVENCAGQVLTTATNTVSISLASGSGISGTLTAAAVKGIATFSPAFSVAGKDTLLAASSGLTAATSSAFTIVAGLPVISTSAQSADAVVDSVGINVHLNYTDTPYVNFSNVESGLLTLGVRHIRDGLTNTSWAGYYSEHNQLGQLGIKSVFITDVGQTAALLQEYPSQMSLCFEGYEAPNEYDNRGVSPWAPPLKTQLANSAKAVTAMATSYPMYGASLVNSTSFATLGNVASYFSYGNLHNYPGGNNPGTTGWGGADAEGNAYGGLAWQMDLLNITSPGLPVVTTETGYFNTVSSGGNGVPEAVSAVYLPRLVLTQWLAGIHRTYLYELVSEGGQDYGLFRSDWSAKPAFYAVSNLLSMLSDEGTTYTPKPLSMGMTGGDTKLRHLLLGKRDGSYYLALWLEASSYNLNTLTAATVAPETITLQLPHGYAVTTNQWDNTGNVSTSTTTALLPMTLSVTDKLMILKIVP